MTGKELKKYFEEHLVPKKLYSINGEKSNRICMTRSGNEWNVFFKDHKDRVGLMTFQSEESACRTMKEELRKMMECVYGLTWA